MTADERQQALATMRSWARHLRDEQRRIRKADPDGALRLANKAAAYEHCILIVEGGVRR